MVRTQGQMTEDQFAQIKQMAAERKISMAEVIGQGVDLLLRRRAEVRREERIARALEATGRFHSDAADVSTNHDRYLAEAYET